MRGLLGVGVCVLVLMTMISSASAQTPAAPSTPSLDDTVLAKMRYERGMAHFRLDEFGPAIAQWEEGFRLKPDPSFLYNIAQAYRLSKQLEKALAFYKKYLKMSPKAPNRAEVEDRIANLEQQIDKQPAAAAPSPSPSPPPPPYSSPPTDTKPQEIAAAAAPAPVPATAAMLPPPSPGSDRSVPAAAGVPGYLPAGANLAAAALPTAERPVYKKAWFWGVVAGVVVAGAAVAVVLVAKGSQSSTGQLPKVVF